IPLQHSFRGPQRHDRSLHGGCDRARARVLGTLRLDRGASGSAARAEVPSEGPMRRWFVVWTLGRELRLWHKRRLTCARDRVVDGEGILSASGALAPQSAEGGWQ